MKTISRHYTSEATIYRMAEDKDEEENYIQEEKAVGTSNGNLQQSGPESAEQVGLKFGLMFEWRCSLDDDIQLGDRLVIDSKSYGVRGSQSYTMGHNRHQKVILEYNE